MFGLRFNQNNSFEKEKEYVIISDFMNKFEFYFRKIVGKIICCFSGHQMFCNISTHKGNEIVLQRYDTTTCQRMCGFSLKENNLLGIK